MEFAFPCSEGGVNYASITMTNCVPVTKLLDGIRLSIHSITESCLFMQKPQGSVGSLSSGL